MQPNILILSTTFPPRGGSSVQRVAKFTKYLPSLGFDCTVITCDEENNTLYDSSLLTDIPCNVEVIRLPKFPWKKKVNVSIDKKKVSAKMVDTIPPKKRYKNPFRLTLRRLLFPDEYLFWMWKATKKGLFLGKKNKIDLIFTSFGSPSALIASYFIKKITKKPWVIDIRDMWSLNTIKGKKGKRPFPIGLLDRTIEPILYNSADRIVVVSNDYKNILINNFRVNKDLISVITNGYDEDDFLKIKLDSNKNKKFTIRYVGFLLKEQKIESFLYAILNLTESGLIPRDKIKIEFIGGTNPDYIKKKFISYNLEYCLSIIGYIEHTEAIKSMSSADLLLLIPGTGKGTITGKIFEYIRSCTPIIMLDQDNTDAKDIIDLLPNSYAVPINKHHIIEEIIASAFHHYSNSTKQILEKTELNDLYKKFSRYSTTCALTKDFNSCLLPQGNSL